VRQRFQIQQRKRSAVTENWPYSRVALIFLIPSCIGTRNGYIPFMHEKAISKIARAIAPLSAPAAVLRTHAYRFDPPSDLPSRCTRRRFGISKQAGISIRACRATRDRIGRQMVFIGGVTSIPEPPSTTDSTARPFLVRSIFRGFIFAAAAAAAAALSRQIFNR